ncbi:MAG: transposase family protein [Anaerolineae bacterium]|nr:transposase family protein [Anaerolineae bacterium]
MLNINRALRSDRLMKALTGMTVAEFQRLLPIFSAALQKAQGKDKKERKRAIGGGRQHTLKSPTDKLFFILLYLKCYPTFDLAGLLYDVDRSQTQRWVKALLAVLEVGLGWQRVLPERRISSLEEFIQRFPAVKDVFVDGTDQPIQRPHQAKAQQEHFSGKHKDHTLKNLMVSDEHKRILFLSQTKPGARQDYFRFKQAGLGEVIPDDVGVWVDLGFLGVVKDYPQLRVVIPPKSSKNHPLTPEQKAENRVISALRICIEHAIAGVKRFRCLTDAYRNKGLVLADKFILIACGLWNYHLLPA